MQYVVMQYVVEGCSDAECGGGCDAVCGGGCSDAECGGGFQQCRVWWRVQ